MIVHNYTTFAPLQTTSSCTHIDQSRRISISHAGVVFLAKDNFKGKVLLMDNYFLSPLLMCSGSS